MGKYKTLAREHDEAVAELEALMRQVLDLYDAAPVSLAEVIGNLEATKHLLLTDAYVEVERALTDDGEEGGPEPPFAPFRGTVRLGAVELDRDVLERIFGDKED